jgi:hypothetical protein
MMEDKELAQIARDFNAAPDIAQHTARHAALIADMNGIIRTAADTLVTLDSSPRSFEALKAERGSQS